MYDYHTHTLFSADSNASFKTMLDAAVNIGIIELAITDHYDPEYANADLPFDLDFKAYQDSLNQYAELYKHKIKLIKGIEIGIQKKVLNKCRIAANSYAYDFILGSFHCARNKELYGGDFFKDKAPAFAYYDFYTYVYECLTNYDEYSVIGHFNIIDRYASVIPDFKGYSDVVEAIMKYIISKGKGLEINTSSYRYGMGENRTPSDEILKLYKSLGGEILTIGSDAHFPEDLACEFPRTIEYLNSFGFKYITTFEKLKSKQIKLI